MQMCIRDIRISDFFNGFFNDLDAQLKELETLLEAVEQTLGCPGVRLHTCSGSIVGCWQVELALYSKGLRAVLDV